MRMTFQSTFITGRICTTSSDIGFDMCDKRVCLKFNKTFSGFVSFAVRGSLARRMQWMLEECRRLSTDKCTTEFCGFVSITYRLYFRQVYNGPLATSALSFTSSKYIRSRDTVVYAETGEFISLSESKLFISHCSARL